MDDLTITRLCADAMELVWRGQKIGWIGDSWVGKSEFDDEWIDYYPLHDDAQAMALVKRFRLAISVMRDKTWMASTSGAGWYENYDLNRAICTCVANLQSAGKGGDQ